MDVINVSYSSTTKNGLGGFYPFGSRTHLTMMYAILVIYLQRLEGKCAI